jgi:hypothetical protein
MSNSKFEGPYGHELRRMASLSPGAIVALCRRSQDDAVYSEDVFETVDRIPEIDLPLARATHMAFSESPLAVDRVYGAHVIASLTRADHDFGLELWHRYARDREEAVRATATGPLIEMRDREPRPRENAVMEGYGITWHEGDWLIYIANRTARGEAQYYDIGGIAVARYLNEPDALTGITPTTFSDPPARA